MDSAVRLTPRWWPGSEKRSGWDQARVIAAIKAGHQVRRGRARTPRQSGGSRLLDPLEWHVVSEQFLERRDAVVRDSTRDDEAEEVEVGVHVEREPVARNPARDAHADGANLPVACVSTQDTDSHRCGGLSLKSRKPGSSALEIAHILMNVTTVRLEVDDWIADELSRTVVPTSRPAPFPAPRPLWPRGRPALRRYATSALPVFTPRVMTCGCCSRRRTSRDGRLGARPRACAAGRGRPGRARSKARRTSRAVGKAQRPWCRAYRVIT